MAHRFESVQQVREGLKDVNYLADDGIAGVAFLADRLGKPVLVEGPAGTGKTQLAKSIAEVTGARLIRLQCYEGLDESKALYEWNYKKQLLRIQADKNSDSWTEVHDDIFSDEFLLTRPLLEAISADDPVVLLIDEVDKADLEFPNDILLELGVGRGRLDLIGGLGVGDAREDGGVDHGPHDGAARVDQRERRGRKGPRARPIGRRRGPW